jgi:hypothetical protein
MFFIFQSLIDVTLQAKFNLGFNHFCVGSDKISMGFFVFLRLKHLNFAFVSRVGVLGFFVLRL